jgi:hypothetical protein
MNQETNQTVNLTTAGFRCGDGVYQVRYELLDIYYHNHHDPITEATIYPDLEPNTLFKVRASLMKWHEDPNKILQRVVESPVFDAKDSRHHKFATSVLDDGVVWALKSQAEPRLKNQYCVKNGRVVPNPEWSYWERPELIRDDSVLEMFDYRKN